MYIARPPCECSLTTHLLFFPVEILPGFREDLCAHSTDGGANVPMCQWVDRWVDYPGSFNEIAL